MSSRNAEAIIIEKLKFHETEICNCGDVKAANEAYNYAIKEICTFIVFKEFDLLKNLSKIKDLNITLTLSLFFLPISEMKTFKRLSPLFFTQDYSFEARTLWTEYKIKKRLKFPRLKDNMVVYVSKEEYLEQFSKDEIKYISSFI